MAPNGLILQWNLQSYRTKFSELKSLLHIHAPLCVCLQETLLNPDHTHFSPSQYCMECNSRTRHDGHERGAALLIHRRLSYRRIPLNTSLQAVAVSLHLERTYTVCSLYLPHIAVTSASLENLLQQLPEPFLLLGDMNAHSPLWGPLDSQTDARGQLFTTLLHNYPISLLNNHRPTHYHVQTGSLSTVDLSLCVHPQLSIMRWKTPCTTVITIPLLSAGGTHHCLLSGLLASLSIELTGPSFNSLQN